jgi:hypothetical protein
MARARAGWFPTRYDVEDASSTVTVWPSAVDTVKLDADTVPTVPHTPPAAGPDRAPVGEGDGVADGAAEVDVAAAGDMAQPAESAITAHISAANPIHLLLVLDRERRTAPPELAPADGPDVALVPWGLAGP